MKLKAKLIVFHTIATIACLAMLLLLVEVFCRVRFPQERNTTITDDRTLGWDGIDPVVRLPHSTTGSAVYFVGDSFVEYRAWPDVVVQNLHTKGMNLQGFNLGVAGYGTTQELLKLRKYAGVQKPKVIVVIQFIWNDLRDDMHFPGIIYAPEYSGQPYFDNRDGRWTLHFAGAFSKTRLLGHSSFFAKVIHPILYQRTMDLLAQHGINYFTEQRLNDVISYGDESGWGPFYNPKLQDGPYIRTAYAVMEHAFLELKKYADEQGASLVVVGFDNAFTVDRDVADQYAKTLSGSRLSLPLERAETILTAHGITYINALPALQAEARRMGRKIYNGPKGNLSAHLEPEGDAVLVRLVTDAIASSLR